MRRIAVISKPQKNELQTLLPELVAWLRAKGLTPVLDPVSGSYIGTGDVVPRQDMAALAPELVIVLGGDGTLLSAAKAFARTEVPILSVNLGSLGFLTEVRLKDLFIALDGWQKGTCRYDVRAMLHVELWREGKLFSEYEALNDVVVAKGAIARMGEFTIHLDGQKVASVRADGMIVATPTGSTGYALSANGPIVLANVNAMVVTPICPHLLTIRPLVVQGEAAIQLKVEGVPDQMYITVDGQEALLLIVGDEVHCKRSQYNVRLIRVHEGGFFDVLRSKLSWGER
jgi:NAD+ kinase